jgi:hypothetical protein
VAELLPLALAAAVWPVLLAVVLIALRAPHPAKLLVCFLAGGLVATMTEGLVIIYALNGSSLTTNDQSTTDAVVDEVAGVLALALAYAMWRRERTPTAPSEKKESKTNKRIEGMLERGAGWAFLAGVVLDLFPSPFALVALKDLAEWDYPFAKTFVVLLLFYLIVFVFIELPLIGYLVAPGRAAERTVRFNAWLARSWYRLAIYGLGFCGVYLVANGIYESFSWSA